MSAIEFVVRSSAGALSRGFVGEGGVSTIAAQAGSDISLNLTRGQIVAYRQEGANLIVTLVDGEEITIANFFGPDNLPAADLYVSSDGLLSEVQLAPGMGGTYYGNYVQQDVYGKWSPDDDLYFVHGDDPALADAIVAPPDEVGMLGMPLLPLAGLAALPLVALPLLDGDDDVLDDDDEREDPEGAILEGTKDAGHVVNAEDRNDGVDISGTGTPGATVDVLVDGHTQTTVIAEDGSWSVSFPPSQIDPGTYETPVVVTVTKDGRTITINDDLVVDTEVLVTFDENSPGADGMVNAVEQDGVVTLSGTVEAGSSVTLVINGVTYAAVVTGTSWVCSLPAAGLPEGEYDQSVSITAVDQYENSTTITGTFEVDTLISVGINTGAIGGNGVINQGEHAAGIIPITGTAMAGSTVVVKVGAVTHTTTALANGTWSVNFTSTEIAGGSYNTTVSATATDGAGNSAWTSGSFVVDTQTFVTFNAATVGGDGHVNGVEASKVVTLTGTCEAGATVMVTIDGTAYKASVFGGTWSLSIPAGAMGGEYLQNVSVSATDIHGNSAQTSGSFQVDTVTVVTFDAGKTGGDGWVNHAENNAPVPGAVTLTGTTEAGNSVKVTLNGTTYTATVTGTTWTLALPAGTFVAGEYAQSATVSATDIHGNTASTSGTFNVDTFVNRLTMTGPVEGDDIVNRAEAGDGVTLTGTVEAGSEVWVSFNGVRTQATVDGAGNWTVTYSAAQLPTVDGEAVIVIDATDHVGNVKSITETVTVDLTPPDAPVIESYTRAGAGVRGFSVAMTEEDYAIHAVAGNGGVSEVAHTTSVNTTFNEIDFDFSAPIPNGSHLVLTATDDAGNATSTLFVLEETLSNTINVGNAGYDRFNIEAIDLQFAEDSVLTLTAADLEALCAHSNALTVHGGLDDTVNIAGATATGQTQTIDGRTYDVYSLGTNGGLLIIDEAITVNT
jgi:hypothetical protein